MARQHLANPLFFSIYVYSRNKRQFPRQSIRSDDGYGYITPLVQYTSDSSSGLGLAQGGE